MNLFYRVGSCHSCSSTAAESFSGFFAGYAKYKCEFFEDKLFRFFFVSQIYLAEMPVLPDSFLFLQMDFLQKTKIIFKCER